MEAVKKGKAKDGEERLLKEQLSYLLPPPLPSLVVQQEDCLMEKQRKYGSC